VDRENGGFGEVIYGGVMGFFRTFFCKPCRGFFPGKFLVFFGKIRGNILQQYLPEKFWERSG
jgi:hypothetical protein